MSMKNRILTGTAIVFAGVIGFFAINTFTSVFTGNGTDTVPISAPAVQAQTPTPTTTAPAAVVSSNRRTPSPAQTQNSDAVAELRGDFVAWSENAQRIIQGLTDSQNALADSQAANTQIIKALADGQSTQREIACQDRLQEIVTNAGRTTSQTTGSGEDTVRTSGTTTLMSELLAAGDEGTGLGIIVEGKVLCAVALIDTGDPNLDGEVSWKRLAAETEE